MSSWFNFCSSPLKGDAHEERPKISRWLGPSRVLKFNEENSVTIPEGILRSHPKFFALWADNQTLVMGGISRQVAHIVINYLYTGAYENLQILRSTSEARNHVDFTTAVQVHNIGVEYHLAELRQLASERIAIYGDNITLVLIVKILSEPPFKNISLVGSLRDYVRHRANQQEEMIPKNVQTLMNGSMAGILCERIASLESEKKQLHEALNRR
ncbi:uncharacterized protein B0J16DRAFT_399143 [Fusarium flagelliforme]|uniref:uncharacterized protein n=1 Tax=Fusarium flagelliforme TaxID=2675880 RepID=UPI001E8EDB3D|nr:uncharacterized protein B0J16DRAFT_399143 [Fusarium flagelliforme]KAH7185389.1 hypothetical protein B0J16DRAFT_399143 [Fusarium flagelliforme]